MLRELFTQIAYHTKGTQISPTTLRGCLKRCGGRWFAAPAASSSDVVLREVHLMLLLVVTCKVLCTEHHCYSTCVRGQWRAEEGG